MTSLAVNGITGELGRRQHVELLIANISQQLRKCSSCYVRTIFCHKCCGSNKTWLFAISAIFSHTVNSCLSVSDNNQIQQVPVLKWVQFVDASQSWSSHWGRQMDWHDDKLSAASVCYITYKYEMPEKKLKISWSLSVDFHFNTHLTISLADMEGKERRASIQERQKSTRIPAHTQAVIMAQRRDSFRKTFHS